MFTAVAIMLGHNFIGHHHHDYEHTEVSHHHNDGHQHDNDTEDESEDWGHFFSGLNHGAEGLTFLTSHGFSKLIPQCNALHVSHLDFQQVIIDVRQNAPPYISDYHNYHNYLPSGLRAPPIFIV
jgi:hypothetical protein